MRRHALESRADRGMRAYVTGSDDARSAMRVRYGLTPRRVLTSSMARHTSGARPSRSTHRLLAAIAGWAQGAAGDACVLGRHHRLRWQRSGQRGDAMVPVVLTERANASIASARGHRANPAILRLHQTYRSSVERRTGTPASDASRVHDRGS